MKRAAEIALGTAQLATTYGVTNTRDTDPTEEEALSFLRHVADEGIRVVDTAPVYGRAEFILGRSPERFRVHTKVHRDLPAAESLAASRRALGSQGIEVLYLHDPDAVLEPDGIALTQARRATQEEDVLLGASIYDRLQFDAAIGDPDIAVVQVPASVLDQRFTGEALAAADASGTKVVVRSALLQGVLAARPEALPPAVAHLAPWLEEFIEVARAHRIEPVDAAIGWVFHLKGVHAVVLGASTPAELDGLLHGARRGLGPAVLADLATLATPDPEACDPRRWAR